MADAIDFYFDFSSPYGYCMSEKIDALAAAHGRTVSWRPILLGVVYKTTGAAPLPQVPLKGGYALRDIERSARFLDVPLRLPEKFPIPTQQAARAFYWLQLRDSALARDFARAAYRAYFVAGQDISQAEAVLDVATTLGVARDELAAALASDEVKALLKTACDEAVAREVFGSPFVVIDGEPFWGVDRLPQIERWLQRGKV